MWRGPIYLEISTLYFTSRILLKALANVGRVANPSNIKLGFRYYVGKESNYRDLSCRVSNPTDG